MFDRRLIQYFDWILLALTAALIAMGLMTLYSAVLADEVAPQKILFYKQLVWLAGGCGVMIVCFVFNYKLLDKYSLLVYGFCILLLVSVLVFGKYVGGSRRWLALGPISIQPSEFIKIGIVVALARYYSRVMNAGGLTPKELLYPAGLLALPFVLIVKQPDLGTALVLALIAGTMTLYVKIERRTLLGIVVLGATAIPLVWSMLKGYQKQRILTFLNPDRDPLGAGYHIIQSKIAIGSGMLTGKGYRAGTQNALSFLPEQHTDFIFSVLAEEWGLMGSGLLLLLFMALLVWGLNIAHSCRDPFGTLVAVGITGMLFWEIFINIGMVMGLMPVVGVPLPLVSYGGSSTIKVMMVVGLLLNISMRRFQFE
ncbi:MAG: rod shape-determining protein RodA [Desulfobacterales bacterium]